MSGLLDTTTMFAIYRGIARKIQGYPDSWFNQLSFSQFNRLGAILDVAAKLDSAAWSTQSWNSTSAIWLKCMHTRRVRSFKSALTQLGKPYMEPLREVAHIMAEEVRLAHRQGLPIRPNEDMPSLGDILGEALRNNDLRKGHESMNTHTVLVRFVSPENGGVSARFYKYLTTIDEVQTGDYLTVWSPITNAPAVVKVEHVWWHTKLSEAFKYVIGMVDLNAHHERVRAEEAKAQRRVILQREIDNAEQGMRRRRAQIQEEVVNDRLATDTDYQTLSALAEAHRNELNHLND